MNVSALICFQSYIRANWSSALHATCTILYHTMLLNMQLTIKEFAVVFQSGSCFVVHEWMDMKTYIVHRWHNCRCDARIVSLCILCCELLLNPHQENAVGILVHLIQSLLTKLSFENLFLQEVIWSLQSTQQGNEAFKETKDTDRTKRKTDSLDITK